MSINADFSVLARALGIVDPFQLRVFSKSYDRVVEVLRDKKERKEDKIKKITTIFIATTQTIQSQIEKENQQYVEALEKDNAALLARNSVLIGRHSQLEAKIQDLIRKVDLFVKKTECLEEENKKLKEDLLKQVREANKKQDHLEQKEAGLNTLIEDCHKKNGQLNADQIKLVQELAQQEEEITDFFKEEKASDNEFRKEIENLEVENERLRYLLEKFEQIKRNAVTLGVFSGCSLAWSLASRSFPNVAKKISTYNPSLNKVFVWGGVAYVVCLSAKRIYQAKSQD